MAKRTLTSETLFAYATAFCSAAEATDKGSQYPTFSETARHFRVRLADVEQACENWFGVGYLGAAVGFQTYAGHAHYTRLGQYKVEAYL